MLKCVSWFLTALNLLPFYLNDDDDEFKPNAEENLEVHVDKPNEGKNSGG